MTLVDTNVIVDVLYNDPVWIGWSGDALWQRRQAGPLWINEIIYAELAARIASEGNLRSAIEEIGVSLERSPEAALFLAGRTFADYRRAGGPRTSLLPNFLIGAHASVLKCPILTRDVRRYRTYFPGVDVITP